MQNVKEMPNVDLPREKAVRFGIESLSDSELLAIILGVGSKENNVIKLANELIFDSMTLFNLANMPYQYFLKFNGISKAKALKLCACFEIAKRYYKHEHIVKEQKEEVTSYTLYKRYHEKVSSLNNEILILVVLNRKRKIIYETTLYVGTESRIPLSPNEILRMVMMHNGHFFYLIHNHPNDFLMASEEDLIFTEEVIRQAKKFNFILLDHLIIGESGYYSYKERQKFC